MIDLRRGSHIRVRERGSQEWTQGRILLVSPNGESIAVALDGSVRAGGGFVVGMLPLVYEPESNRYLGLTSEDAEYELEIAES